MSYIAKKNKQTWTTVKLSTFTTWRYMGAWCYSSTHY